MSNEQLVYDGLQACPYRPGQVARMPLFRQRRPLSPAETDERFANAERRVGRSLYRTACPTCTACRGLRIPVDELRPSRSQKRVLKRWKALEDRLTIRLQHPTCTDEKLAIFHRHKTQRGLTDAGDEPMDAHGYLGWLVHSCVHTVEMTYTLDDRLIAVGILDLGATASSSVYFYFDPTPEIARLSPGVFSVFQEAAFARRTGRRYHYLGLWVSDCPSLAYKANYYPHERLRDGDWRRVERPVRAP